MPAPASGSANAVMALVVARTSHTLVTRRPGTDPWGTRVHTFADASASISSLSGLTSPSSSHRDMGGLAGGLGQGTEIPSGVLVATMRDPFWSDPGARLTYGLKARERSASRASPHPFSRRHDVPARDMGTDENRSLRHERRPVGHAARPIFILNEWPRQGPSESENQDPPRQAFPA
jgi:hypothetical protein